MDNVKTTIHNFDTTLYQCCARLFRRCFNVRHWRWINFVATLKIRRRILLHFQRQINIISTLIHNVETTLIRRWNVGWNTIRYLLRLLLKTLWLAFGCPGKESHTIVDLTNCLRLYKEGSSYYIMKMYYYLRNAVLSSNWNFFITDFLNLEFLPLWGISFRFEKGTLTLVASPHIDWQKHIKY